MIDEEQRDEERLREARPNIQVLSVLCCLTLSLSSYLLSALRRRRGCEERSVTRRRADEPTTEGPDCYQRLEFFIQVLRVLCPNLTDASLVVSRVPRLVSVISLFVRASLASPSVTLLSSPYHPARRDRAGGEEDG